MAIKCQYLLNVAWILKKKCWFTKQVVFFSVLLKTS